MLQLNDDFILLQDTIGSGGYATVYKAYSRNLQREIALKIQAIEEDDDVAHVKNEYYMGNIFSQYFETPKQYFLDFSENADGDTFSAIGMELLNEEDYIDLHTLLKTEMSDDVIDDVVNLIDLTIKTMCENDLIHGDFHWHNFLLKMSPTPLKCSILLHNGQYGAFEIYDFGLASESFCDIQMYYLQLMRTLFINNFNEENKYKLLERLVQKYTEAGYNIEDLKENGEINYEKIKEKFDVIISDYFRELKEFYK